MLPVVTTLGMVFSFLLGANVLVEKVFAWPGIGSYAVEALISSDFAPVQGFVLTMAVLYVLLNLMIDILYGVIDPRSEAGRMSSVASRRRAAPPPRAPRASPRSFEHARYVLGENRSPAVAFGLFVCDRAVRAVRPLCGALRSAGQRHRGGAEAAVMARIGSAPTSWAAIFSAASSWRRGSTLVIAVASVALVFADGRPCRHRRRLFRRLDRPHRRPHRRHHHGVSAVRAGDGHRRRARQYRAPTSSSPPRSSISRSTPASRAPRPTCGATPASCRRRGCPATANSASCWCTSCPTSCRS